MWCNWIGQRLQSKAASSEVVIDGGGNFLSVLPTGTVEEAQPLTYSTTTVVLLQNHPLFYSKHNYGMLVLLIIYPQIVIKYMCCFFEICV